MFGRSAALAAPHAHLSPSRTLRSWRVAFVVCAAFATVDASAATSPHAVPSPFGGNGHNVTFDGRLFIVAHAQGWDAAILRPQNAAPSNGFVDMSQTFSPYVLIQPSQYNENALAICEDTPQPFTCDQNGIANGAGAYACYEVVIIDSDALAQAPNDVMRQRKLRVVVANPNSPSATIDSFTWLQATPVPLSTTLRGIEPSITRDGKLLVWQGHPSNNGDIDTLVYSVNSQPCSATGWSAPKSITAMSSDPAVVGKYKLAEKPLRGADGVTFTASQVLHGAYPWIFPDGEAVNFTAVPMPCMTPPPNEVPFGCGPRRNALSFIGYPTNWQLAHVDGEVNPDTDATVRLFFSSPGPLTHAPSLPVTQAKDVWPFFGSNTSNYTEIVFDDGLDGNYAALWHFNELVDNTGNFDLSRTADSSGYSNTATLVGGAYFPTKNNGHLGKAIVFNGTSSRVQAPHTASLNPVNAITVEAWVKPGSDPNCDGNNNYRLLVSKGNLGGAYSLVLEENRDLQFRVRVTGGTEYSLPAFTTLPIGQWSHVVAQYDAASGVMNFLINDVETNRVTQTPALIEGTTDKITIGGPDGVRAACPNGDGVFDGELDEVAISRIWRYGTPVPPVVDAGTPPQDAGSGEMDAGSTTTEPDAGGGTTTPDAGGGMTAQDAGSSGNGGNDAGMSTPPGSDAGSSANNGGNGGGNGNATGDGSGGDGHNIVGVESCSTTAGGATLWALTVIAAGFVASRRRRAS